MTKINERELCSIIAALRFYVAHKQHIQSYRCGWMDEIATNDGELTSLSEEDIGELVARLNPDAPSCVEEEHARG